MRILITGQTGVSKATLARNLEEHYFRKRGLNSQNNPGEIAWYELENERWLTTPLRNFITGFDLIAQKSAWVAALNKIIAEVNSKPTKHSILFLHATFFRDGRVFSPVCWDELLKFQPDCVVTLIDDVYDIWQRIKDRQHLQANFSLQEILTWRNTEILYSETLANEIRIDNSKFAYKVRDDKERLFGKPMPFYVVSVKHSLEVFDRLLFERHLPVIYASFPITRTRSSERRKGDIDNFRRGLRNAGATVFDPLTIDELKMSPTSTGKDGKPVPNPEWYELSDFNRFLQYQEKRWAITSPAVKPPDYTASPFESLNQNQIDDVVKTIQAQIIDRDYRLVGQSQQTIAYRPFYPKDNIQEIFGTPTPDPTGGVTTEIRYALQKEQDVWVFHPKCDYHTDQEDRFFVDSAIWRRVRRFPNEEAFEKAANTDFVGFEELLAEVQNKVVKSETARQL